jgi:hypothetical protein
MSLSQIGGYIGRDHTTIIYAVNRCQALYDTCKQFRLMANKVLDALDLLLELWGRGRAWPARNRSGRSDPRR